MIDTIFWLLIAWLIAAACVGLGWFLARRLPPDPDRCDFCRHTPIRRRRR